MARTGRARWLLIALLAAFAALLLPPSGAPVPAAAAHPAAAQAAVAQPAAPVSSHPDPDPGGPGGTSWHGDHAVPPSAVRPAPAERHAAPAGGADEPACAHMHRPRPTALRITEPAHVTTPRLLSHDTGRAPPPPAHT